MERKKEFLILCALVVVIGSILAGTLSGQVPLKWMVYSNTQQYEETIDPPTTKNYPWSAKVYSGANDLVIRQGIGGPVVLFVNNLTHDSSGTVYLENEHEYHMGTDDGQLPTPGTCKWTVWNSDYNPDAPEEP